MILLAIGFFLLLFGVFVFFKKNEGETELSILGVTLKSNNSAILLVCLGAVLAAVGATSFDGKPTAREVPETETGSDIEPEERSDGKEQKELIAPDPAKENKKLLIGTWEYSEVISGEEAINKLYERKSDAPPGLQVTYMVEQKHTFNSGGSFNGNGYLNFLLRGESNETQDIKINVSYSGEWKIAGNELIETITGSSALPGNELTKDMFRTRPFDPSEFNLAVGTEQTYVINNVNESTLTISNKRTGIKSTWIKNN